MLSTAVIAASLARVNPWLTIAYGAAYTRAVLVWPGGAWRMLPFDGSEELSSAVHVSPAGILAGAAAWHRAEIDPDGFVLSPLRAGVGQVWADGLEVDTAELAARTLREVGAEAARLAGEPVTHVRVVVPAEWGPRRQRWLRQAAGKAGLPVSEVVVAPAAALANAPGGPIGTGHIVMVLDLGAGCEVSVLQQDATRLEVVSLLSDSTAGGDQLDTALLAAVTGADLDALPAQQRWPLLAAVRNAKHSLTTYPAVTMPRPDGQPPAVVTTALVRQAVQPLGEQVAKLALEALDNADLTVEQVQAVYAIGGAAATPGITDVVTAKLGAVPKLVERPATAALLSAAHAAPHQATSVEPAVRTPPLRRIFSLSLPAVASLLLYAHFVFAADFYNGTPRNRGPYFYVLASWGELAASATFAVVAFLQAGPLLATLRDQQHPPEPGTGLSAGGRISTGIGAAIAAGAATAGMYAVVAAVYMNQPISALLRWSLLPALPTLVVAAVLLTATWRTERSPRGGWDAFLTFPASSVATGAFGVVSHALYWHGRLPAWMNGWHDLLGGVGAVLVATAVACALVRHPGIRIGLTVVLSFFLLIIARSGPDIAAVLYSFAVASWWARRAWTVLRLPALALAG